MRFTLGELASHAGATVAGDAECVIGGVGTLAGAQPGQITFLTNPRYRRQLDATRASAVILDSDSAKSWAGNALVAANPHVAYARVASLFASSPETSAGVHFSAVVEVGAVVHATAVIGPHAVIGSGSEVGEGVSVGPGCVVGPGVVIGAGSRLAANVSVYAGCRIGERVLIHSGAVIGSDGFGFADDGGRWLKVPQLGRVVIGDDVEIGACTTIDRGAIEDTVIEQGVKLDNQIQVAHNVRIGAHTAVAGCVGISGSTTIGRHCRIGGGVGILGHLEIADGVTITPTSLVTKSIRAAGYYSSGTPLEPTEQWQKNFARFKQLDDMARRIKALEKELKDLKG